MQILVLERNPKYVLRDLLGIAFSSQPSITGLWFLSIDNTICLSTVLNLQAIFRFVNLKAYFVQLSSANRTMTEALRNTLIVPLKQIHDGLEPLTEIRHDVSVIASRLREASSTVQCSKLCKLTV